MNTIGSPPLSGCRARSDAACNGNASRFFVMILLIVTSAPARSANGMNAPGNGTVQLGMAGAGTAMVEDASATLRNPAAGAWLPNSRSFDLGAAIPDGGFRASDLGANSPFGLIDLAPGQSTSVTGVFPVPSFARNWRINDQFAAGWGLTASGLATESSGSTATLARGVPGFEARCNGTFGGGQPLSVATDLLRLCGRSQDKLGVGLMQVLISGHGAYRISPTLSIGVAPVVALQLLKVKGLGAFAAFSNEPDRATDNGNDFSYGGGIRVGVLWEALPIVGIGLAYQSRLYTSTFNRYSGAIIGGSLDFAPTLNVGLQIRVAPEQRLLFDIEHIAYSSIRPLANTVDPQRFTDTCFVPRLIGRSLPNPPALDGCLGSADGPGFGWQSVTVYKFGYQGRRGRLSYRAGYSFGGNPLIADQALPAVFAPAITDQHASVGLSWRWSQRLSLNWALIYSVANHMRVRNVFSNATPTVLHNGTLVGFRVDEDPNDQVIDAHLSVWQSQFGLAWTFD